MVGNAAGHANPRGRAPEARLIGVGASTGAITIVNALFTGVGCAAAIDLPVRVQVDLRVAAPGEPGSLHVPPESDSPLARASALDAVHRFGGAREFDSRLWIESAIPPAAGLKSSSALGVAVGRAVASALGATTSAQREASASAQVSRAVGLSATGAFDDAYAAAAGGIALTENGTETVLAHGEADPDWVVLLWIPDGTHSPSPAWHARFRELAEEAAPAVDAARDGRWLAALERNSVLVERALGVDRSAERRRLAELGALASGVSGMGPAFASIVPRDLLPTLIRSHPGAGGDLRVAEFVRAGAPRGGSG